MKIYILFCFSIVFVMILANMELSFSITVPEKTILKLHNFNDHRFDGGQPIVFVGKLTSEAGERIPSAKILIKSDGPCPEDGIIASGFTDKYGRFWIHILTKIWDESDNMIKVHAEFEGNEKSEASISDERIIVIYPSHAERCVN